MLSCMSCLCILEYESLISHIIWKYFLPFCKLSFYFVNGKAANSWSYPTCIPMTFRSSSISKPDPFSQVPAQHLRLDVWTPEPPPISAPPAAFPSQWLRWKGPGSHPWLLSAPPTEAEHILAQVLQWSSSYYPCLSPCSPSDNPITVARVPLNQVRAHLFPTQHLIQILQDPSL